jgi:predicted DNA binding CopG/RHH family protein
MKRPSNKQTAKGLKPIPKFASEDEAREFWDTHDSADYIDWSKATLGTFSNARAPTTAISIRLPAGLLAELKSIANARDVPYQSLMKMYLADRVEQEHRLRRAPGRKRKAG